MITWAIELFGTAGWVMYSISAVCALYVIGYALYRMYKDRKDKDKKKRD